MNSEVLDYRLQHTLRAMIDKLPPSQQIQLKNLKLCNTKTIPQLGVEPAVFLLRREGHNGGEGKFYGQATCKNPWACPHCSAKIMRKYAIRIGACLDALHDKYFAFMVTFTIPHYRFMSCKETTDILYNTWRYFHIHNFRGTNTHGHVFNAFYHSIKIKYRVRACEYTWGKNGWHPHFHVIYWCEKEHKDEILNWQKELNEFWTKTAVREANKYWEKNELHTEAQRQTIFSEVNDKWPCLKISTDKDGQILRVTSSEYMCGWGADKELTGNYQKEASHDGHYTPYQILDKASHGDEEMKKLYIEYMLNVTRKPVHHRVDFSSGMVEIAKVQMQTQAYKDYIIQKKTGTTEWRVLYWFSPSQWSEICYRNRFSPVISNLAYLAAINRKDLIEEYLIYLEVPLTTRQHHLYTHIEKMFNSAA